MFNYIWCWKKWPLSSWDSKGAERYKQNCKVLVRANGRGPRNILVEFEDGVKIVAPRFAVRQKKGQVGLGLIDEDVDE